MAQRTGAQHALPVTIHTLVDAPSVTRPSRSTRIASSAPASRAACLASTLGSSATDLMSQRAQRWSGAVMADAAQPSASAGYGGVRRQVTTRAGGTGCLGKACSRRATPRVTCMYTSPSCSRLRRTTSSSTRRSAARPMGGSMEMAARERSSRAMCKPSSRKRPAASASTS